MDDLVDKISERPNTCPCDHGIECTGDFFSEYCCVSAIGQCEEAAEYYSAPSPCESCTNFLKAQREALCRRSQGMVAAIEKAKK